MRNQPKLRHLRKTSNINSWKNKQTRGERTEIKSPRGKRIEQRRSLKKEKENTPISILWDTKCYFIHKTKLGHIKEETIGNKKEFLEIKNEIGKILNSIDNLKNNVKEMSHNAEQNDLRVRIRKKSCKIKDQSVSSREGEINKSKHKKFPEAWPEARLSGWALPCEPKGPG